MSYILTDKVAIITGAGRGIGKATALAFAEAGAAVVLVARSEDELNSVADEIKDKGGKSLAIPTDISDVSQVDHLLILALRAFGKIDILVNNAALIRPMGKVWESSPTDWHRLIVVNVVGPYLCTRAMLPQMIERGSGRIINVSSGVAAKNLQGTSAYNASKAALERFSGTLAAELEGKGIDVTVFRPGVVDTVMQSVIRQTPAHSFPRAADWQKLYDQKQLRPTTEPAFALLWLASHFAAGSNGQSFYMDDASFRERIASDLGLSPIPPRERNV